MLMPVLKCASSGLKRACFWAIYLPHSTAGVLQVQSIVETLLEALPTPSYSVQEAVSDCLAPLMSGLATDKTYVESLAQRLLTATLSGPDYPHRYPAPLAAITDVLTD